LWKESKGKRITLIFKKRKHITLYTGRRRGEKVKDCHLSASFLKREGEVKGGREK